MASSFAFAVLAVTLAAVGRIDPVEAAWAAVSVAVIFVPTGWWAPVGWRRRCAEAVLVLPAWALVMLAGPGPAHDAAPAAVWRWRRGRLSPPPGPASRSARRVSSVVLLAVSARAATGVGLVGHDWWRIALTFGACAAVAWAAARLGGRDLGIAVALLGRGGAVPVLTGCGRRGAPDGADRGSLRRSRGSEDRRESAGCRASSAAPSSA